MTIESENKDLSILDLDKISPEEEYTSDQGRLGDKQMSLDRRKVEADLQKSMQRGAQGVVGRILGDKDHAPTNVVAVCLVLLVVATTVLASLGSSAAADMIEVTKAVLFAAMGYFAGARTVGRSRSLV